MGIPGVEVGVLQANELRRQLRERHVPFRTGTEGRVLAFIEEGYTNEEVAQLMDVAPATVRRHVADFPDLSSCSKGRTAWGKPISLIFMSPATSMAVSLCRCRSIGSGADFSRLEAAGLASRIPVPQPPAAPAAPTRPSFVSGGTSGCRRHYRANGLFRPSPRNHSWAAS